VIVSLFRANINIEGDSAGTLENVRLVVKLLEGIMSYFPPNFVRPDVAGNTAKAGGFFTSVYSEFIYEMRAGIS